MLEYIRIKYKCNLISKLHRKHDTCSNREYGMLIRGGSRRGGARGPSPSPQDIVLLRNGVPAGKSPLPLPYECTQINSFLDPTLFNKVDWSHVQDFYEVIFYVLRVVDYENDISFSKKYKAVRTFSVKDGNFVLFKI